MGGIDLKAVLAAGAYGAGLLFFAYGAYVLVNAKSGQQGVNVRWFLGIGAVVFLALVGLDLVRLLHEKERIAPKVFLSFAPTSSEVGLPEPRVTYNGVQRPAGSAIEISDTSATITVSVEKIIAAVKQLRESKANLETALGQAVAQNLPQEMAAQVASVADAPEKCDENHVACGWVQLSKGDLGAAQETFEKVVAAGSPASPAQRAVALQGLGEIYAGQGRVDEARQALTKAGSLGNANAKKRLAAIAATRPRDGQ